MNDFNKKRNKIAEWCKKGYENPNMYQPQSFGGAIGQGLKDTASGALSIAGSPAGTAGMMAIDGKYTYGQGKTAYNAWQAGQKASTSMLAKHAPNAFRVGAKAPLISTVASAGLLGYEQYNMNRNAKNMGGMDVYRNSAQYQQDKSSRNRALFDTSVIAGGAAIGAGVGLFGGPAAPVTVAGGAALGATIGSTVALGRMGGQMVSDKWRQYNTGYDPEQAMYTDHLIAGNQGGDAVGYASTLLNRTTGEYMNRGANGKAKNNASHGAALASSVSTLGSSSTLGK